MRIDDKQILWITGASGGIGRALAARASELGLRCLLQSRQRIESLSEDSLIVQSDIGDATAAREAIERCRERFGAVPDLLCHTVGSVALAPFKRASLTQLKEQFHANVETAFVALQAFSEAREEAGGGAAVLFSSVAARMGTPNHAVIAASKAALEGMVRAVATEWAPRRIRINALALGLTETPLTASFVRDSRSRQAVESQYPLGRCAQPSEVADAALWLLSPSAAWMTGQCIAQDGGFSSIRPLVRSS